MRACDKPWLAIEIEECGEPLQALPPDFYRISPHPYIKLGAPYADSSPYCLRSGAVSRLLAAHKNLQAQRPGWRFRIFDAYRPNAVQSFMVEHCYQQMAAQAAATDSSDDIWQQVYTFWAQPSMDVKYPPAHSTGAAIDLTLQDERGQAIDMGTPIDDFSERARPDYFDQHSDTAARQVAQNRALLTTLLCDQGFAQHPHEWWHFSFGDQLWAWSQKQTTACYGRADLI